MTVTGSTQESAEPTRAARRDEGRLVIPRLTDDGVDGAPLPPLCVKCGSASEREVPITYSWHEGWLYLLLAFFPLYLVARASLRKRLHVVVPLCAQHHSRLNRVALAGWAVVIAGFVVMLLAVNGVRLDGLAGLLMLALFVGGGLVVVAASPIKPVRIDDEGGAFRGCGEEFLRQLP